MNSDYETLYGALSLLFRYAETGNKGQSEAAKQGKKRVAKAIAVGLQDVVSYTPRAEFLDSKLDPVIRQLLYIGKE